MAAVDSGDLTAGEAEGFRRRGVDLRQGLSYAASTGKLQAVLVLAQECSVRLEAAGTAWKLPDNKELMRLASIGDWASVAYFLGCAAADDGTDSLLGRLQATDIRARKELRKASGVVLGKLPYDLCVAFTKAGQMGPDLFVENHRWTQPRPDKDHCFLVSGDAECPKCRCMEQPSCQHARGKKLPEGWYSVVQYPLGDELRKVVLRRKDWKWAEREASATMVRDVGETLLCKAAKATQWELVGWMLRNSGDAAELSKQLEMEWQGTWDDNAEWRARLQDREDLASLMSSLEGSDKDSSASSSGCRLQRPWHRGGAVAIPAGAVLRSPRLEVLREAWGLEHKAQGIALEALRMVDCNEICLVLPSPLSEDARSGWLQDLGQLATEDEECLGTPLLHRLALAGRAELLQELLEAMASPEVRNRQGLTALAMAARANRWEVCEKLLANGCSADGRSGTMALVAAERASRAAQRKGATEQDVDDARRASELMEVMNRRKARPPAASLSDFFARQAKGEVMHGVEPRNFKLEQGELRPVNGAGPSIWARAVIVGSSLGGDGDAADKESNAVLFAVLSASAYETAQTAEALEVGRMRLLPEEQLLRQGAPTQAVAVSVPTRQLVPADASGQDISVELEGGNTGVAAPPFHYETVTELGRRMRRQVGGRKQPVASKATPSFGRRAQIIRPEGSCSSRFAASLPVLARAPPTGSLHVESWTSCCSKAIGRILLLVDGIGLGETSVPLTDDEPAELEVLVPAKELEICTEISGRPLTIHKMKCVPQEDIRVEVPIGIYVYTVALDDDDDEDCKIKQEPVLMVFVAGHRRDIPEEGKPFIGTVRWNTGQARLDSWRQVVLGCDDCLELLRSCQFFPDLKPGRRFNLVEWEDTSIPAEEGQEAIKECQFKRILINPVRVGEINNC